MIDLIHGKFEDHIDLLRRPDTLIVTDAPLALTAKQWRLLCDNDSPLLMFYGLRGIDSLRKKIVAVNSSAEWHHERVLTAHGPLEGNMGFLLYGSTAHDHPPNLRNGGHSLNYNKDHDWAMPVDSVTRALNVASYHLPLSRYTVVDPFVGSGTTLLAAHAHGLNSIGIEREKEYYDIALERIKSIGVQVDA